MQSQQNVSEIIKLGLIIDFHEYTKQSGVANISESY